MKKQKAGRSQDSFEDEPIGKDVTHQTERFKVTLVQSVSHGQTDRPSDMNRGKHKQANSSQQWEEDKLQ